LDLEEFLGKGLFFTIENVTKMKDIEKTKILFGVFIGLGRRWVYETLER